jgi:acyl-CoA reductase-like NAD-dependent aldehyde dehydrogenase
MNSSSFSTVNPATGEQIEAFPFLLPAKQKPRSLVPKRASNRIANCRCINVHNSSRTLQRLRKDRAQLAKAITTEMGKTLSEAEAEVERCAGEADW